MKLSWVLVLSVLVTATQTKKLLPESAAERPALSDATHEDLQGTSAVGDTSVKAEGERGVPIVNAKRFTRYKRSLQFDGWYPMDVSNPMADDPTVGYQPPPLQRVHFSNEPVPKKPLYPVRPENPTVFVVRAEPRHPEYHSVYGTENIEYFHVHPQTNIVRAFRAPSQSVGAIRFVPAPQFGDLRPSSRSTSDADTLEDSSKKHGNDTHLNIDFSYQDVPAKDAGFADKLDAFDANGSSRFPEESPRLDADNDYDMEGAYSEIRSTIVERPSHVLPFSRRDRIPGSSKQQNAHSYRYRPDPPTRDRRPNQQRDQELKTTRPALHELLGNLPQETQIEEIPYVGSATDSAGVSFIRKIPPPDFRYSSRGSNKQRQSLNNTRSHPRGTQVRQAAGNFTQTFSRPWFLIDTRSEVSDRKREPSIASYIHPETRSDDKIHYKPLGPISYVSKEGDKTASEHIHNPHLDDHMNSYKPTLTANSLSELLQIFRFTQVTDGPDSEDATDEPVTIPREFRYTRPTEEPPITTTTTVTSSTQSTTHRSNIHSKNFQTSTTPRYNDTTTEAEDTKKTQGGDFDAVADTNSLDGYLFSDSEASPEYAHPQVRPNVVTTKVKDEVTTKGVTKETSRVSVQTSTNSHVFQESSEPKETFKGLEIIYPGQSSRRTPEASWPLYIIHQGHSKVRVFGINSAEDKKLGNPDYRELFVLSTLEPRASSPVPFTRNATTNEIPATASTSTSPTGTTIPFTSSFTILDTSPTTTSVTNPPTSSAAATTSVPQPTSRTPSFPIEQNRTTSIPTDKMTTTPPSTPVETTILSNTPVETTTMPPSTSVKTTTVLPSTLIETTTSPPTTLIETTTSPPATLFETTTSPPSTSVETTATPDSTLDETTTTHPNAPTTNEDLVPANETAGEYEYYYTDDQYSIPELAFGKDDKSEDSARPALMLPDPTPLPVEEMPDALASATSFSRFLQDRLSRVKSLLQQGGLHQPEPEDAVPLASATGLTRPERSVGRPVFFIKRLAEATEEASLTQPSGYLSQLRSEKRTPLTDTEDTPRMKRVTEAATEA
ncbi:hypothetical protein OTU49_001771 [Cherax quadricarinatus]|uniref:Uncharacterized protein n=1 Tax=Cherax quadricarinatus TaxID=27406 RepID=A0AAW0XH28_CHEQU